MHVDCGEAPGSIRSCPSDELIIEGSLTLAQFKKTERFADTSSPDNGSGLSPNRSYRTLNPNPISGLTNNAEWKTGSPISFNICVMRRTIFYGK
jgi:hypothetical protein